MIQVKMITLKMLIPRVMKMLTSNLNTCKQQENQTHVQNQKNKRYILFSSERIEKFFIVYLFIYKGCSFNTWLKTKEIGARRKSAKS